jgi:hypothetical protein
MRTIIIYFLLCLITLSTKAQDVDEKTARKVAENYFDRNVHDSIKSKYRNDVKKAAGVKLNVKKTDLKTFKGNPSYYINNLEGGGWVLVSADKKTGPVIAYSEFGYYDPDSVPEVITDWMAQYDTTIFKRRKITVDTVIEKKNKKWKQYENENKFSVKSSGEWPSYLIQSTWHQFPYYNNMIDHFSTYNDGNYPAGTRCPAGCSSIAISQIVRYYGYASGNSADFAFWNMPDDLNTNSTQEEKNAVCYMIKTIGTDHLQTIYCRDGYLKSSANRTKATFEELGYHIDDLVEMHWYYTYNDWLAMLRTSLNAGHPIIYRYNDGNIAHEFICDGYNSNGNNLHFNLGYENVLCNLIWVDFEDLDLREYYEADYSDITWHEFYRGIYPIISNIITINGTTINTNENKTWQANFNLIANSLTINPGARCNLIAGDNVLLNPGFWVKPGSNFTARAYTSDNIVFAESQKAEATNISNKQKIFANESLNNVNIEVFPNPCTNYITISFNKIGHNFYQLVNLYDEKVLSGSFSLLMNYVNVQNVPKGTYILKIYSDHYCKNFKIIHL